MSIRGKKYLKKGLEEINLTAEDCYDYISRYSDKCTHLLWRIESLLWELDHLEGIPTKFDRVAWDENKITLKRTLEIPPTTSEKFPDTVRKYVELMIQSLKEDGDSLNEDLINWKECLGLKGKKILSGIKKYE